MPPTGIEWVREQLARHKPLPIDADLAPRRAAVSIIIKETASRVGEQGRCAILFIHRSQHVEDPWSGHMAFPGGRVDPGDASSLDAARRETLEEVGIDLASDAELLGQLDDQRAASRGVLLPMAITPFVFHLLRPVELRPNEEVAEALWIPVSQLLDPSSAATVPYAFEGQHFDLPCIKHSGHTIWGLTYQMVSRLFRLLEWIPG